MLEVVSSLSAWPGSARLLRETGLLDQLLGVHASETAGPAATEAARAVLSRVALHNPESAKRVHAEILSKVAFVLPRHQGLDVRGLLRQDLLLLRSLCLSPAAALAAVAIVGDTGGGGGSGRGEEKEGAAAAATVASCWRLHVGLLLDILRRVPAAADDSVAVVNHVVLPCLETVAALCLDGVDFPPLQGEGAGSGGSGSDDDEQLRRSAWATRRTAASPAPGGDELVEAASGGGGGGSRVEDVLLREMLRASEAAWAPGSAHWAPPSAHRVGVDWTTPAQAREIESAGPDSAPNYVNDYEGMMTRPAESPLWRLSGAGAGAGVGFGFGSGLGGAPRSSSLRCFPQHWLLRLMASRQSPVLRTFTGMVIGALAAFKGPGALKDVAEAAAHLLGVVGAEGSEAAGLQVSYTRIYDTPPSLVLVVGRLCGENEMSVRVGGDGVEK